jgi:hypothetical protein
MTDAQFDAAYRAFCRRRPFRTFIIEFTSASQVPIVHPEAVRNESQAYVARLPDGSYVVFAADGVARLLDGPASQAASR